jgi:hypothetical protein
LGIGREKVKNSRRFLVAALLGMTRRNDPRNVPFPAVIANPLLPCHPEPPTRVSFRTPYSRVIPNVVRNPQLGIGREKVKNSRRFLVAALLGMTRRNDPRNAPFPAVIANPLLACHPEPPTPVSFRTPYSRVIPNVVRNPQLGIGREKVKKSRRFLVAALLGMTRGVFGFFTTLSWIAFKMTSMGRADVEPILRKDAVGWVQ